MKTSSSKPIKNLPASVHDRLATLAKKRGRPFQEILEYYAIERFLFRLSQSHHARHFVLKGGQVLLAWGIPLQRPTRDIDLQASAAISDSDLEDILKEVCAQPVDPDGLTFHPDPVLVQHIIANATPPGIRVRFSASLGAAKIPMQIDITFAAETNLPTTYVDYPPLLGMPAPRLRGCSHVTVVAEKVHAMVSLGMINSRLKDFYDTWLISQILHVSGVDLTAAMVSTFRARRTLMPDTSPSSFSDQFAQEKQREWQALLASFPQSKAIPANFLNLLVDLRRFLLPPLQAAESGNTLDADWNPGGPWIAS